MSSEIINLAGTSWAIISDTGEQSSIHFKISGHADLKIESITVPQNWWQNGNEIWFAPVTSQEGFLVYTKGQIESSSTIQATKVVGQPQLALSSMAITLKALS